MKPTREKNAVMNTKTFCLICDSCNNENHLQNVVMWLEGGKVQGYEMSGTRGRQLFEANKLFEETKLSKLLLRLSTL